MDDNNIDVAHLLQDWLERTHDQLIEDAKCMAEIKKELTVIKIEQAKLKTNVKLIWSGVGGIGTVFAALLIYLLKNIGD